MLLLVPNPKLQKKECKEKVAEECMRIDMPLRRRVSTIKEQFDNFLIALLLRMQISYVLLDCLY